MAPPPKLCSVIERLYTDLKVILKLGKSKAEILQEVGVRQGDNMAPVLFLFLMAAFAELMEDVWERENMEKVEFLRESDDTYRKGQLFRHSVKSCKKSASVILFDIMATIYVDDTAVPFTSRSQLCKGLSLIQKLFSDLGMEMHTGSWTKRISKETGEMERVVAKESKTECVFVAAPG